MNGERLVLHAMGDERHHGGETGPTRVCERVVKPDRCRQVHRDAAVSEIGLDQRVGGRVGPAPQRQRRGAAGAGPHVAVILWSMRPARLPAARRRRPQATASKRVNHRLVRTAGVAVNEHTALGRGWDREAWRAILVCWAARLPRRASAARAEGCHEPLSDHHDPPRVGPVWPLRLSTQPQTFLALCGVSPGQSKRRALEPAASGVVEASACPREARRPVPPCHRT